MKNKRGFLIAAILIVGNLSYAAGQDINNEEAVIVKVNNVSGTGSGNGFSIHNSGGNGDNSFGKIINTGTISAEAAGTGTSYIANGNGISIRNSSTATPGSLAIGDVENTGTIKGRVLLTSTAALSSSSTGNGIGSYNGSNDRKSLIGDISNDGIVSGRADLRAEGNLTAKASGNGISSYTTVTNPSGSPVGKESTIGNVSNNGLISGYSRLTSNGAVDIKGSGNGISSFGISSAIGNIENQGKISGKSDFIFSGGDIIYAVGNGISSYGLSTSASSNSNKYSRIGTIKNKGIVSGELTAEQDNLTEAVAGGNGISAYNFRVNLGGSIEDIENSGIIRGKSVAKNSGSGFGNGIYANGELKTVTNTGLIAGSGAAISASAGTIHNYGVMAGQEILKGEMTENLYGVNVLLDEEGKVLSIVNGTKTSAEKNILNAEIQGTDSSIDAASEYRDMIINGTGIETGVLNIQNSTETVLESSIINAYHTAVHLSGDSGLKAVDTVFNGGGLDGSEAVIKGSNGNNDISIKGNSVINGNVVLEGDSNKIEIGNSAVANGDFIATGTKDNTINLGVEGEQGELDIFGKIDGFQKIDVTGDVTLFETASIKNGEEINLSEGSNLTVKIDLSGTDNSLAKSADGKYINHALYNTGAAVTTDGGNLVISAAGISIDSIIGMGTTDISGVLDGNLLTNSIVHEIRKTDDFKDIEVVIDKTLPRTVNGSRYENLNHIWSAIVDSQQVSSLDPTIIFGENNKTKEEAETALHDILEDILIGNPSSLTPIASKSAMNNFNNVVINSSFKPAEDQWLVYGGVLYNSADADNEFEQTSYFNGSMDADTDIFSAYGRGEYGYDDDISFGVVFGGSRINVKNSTGSKLDGNSAYLGVYAGVYLNDIQYYAGAGYQYTSFSGDRVARNNYQSISNGQDFATNGVNGYLAAKTDYELGNGIILQPHYKLSITQIDQDSINEGNGYLALNIEEKSFRYFDSELGVNLIKDIEFDSGIGRLKLGAAWIRLLNGYDETDLTAAFKNGGDSFQLLVPESDKDRGKITLSYEFEKETGWSYYLGGDYIVSSNINDFTVRLSTGYKF